MQFIVPKLSSPERLDKVLDLFFDDYSRSKLQKLIDSGAVFVNSTPILKSSFKLYGSESIRVNFPEISTDLVSMPVEFDILYEDRQVLIINKSPNLLVHPPLEHINSRATVVHGLLDYLGESILSVGSDIRPGIVHRLDKDTSGVMLIAKTGEAYINLVEQFSKRTVKKSYIALVAGYVAHDKATINAPIVRSPALKKMLVKESHYSRPSVTHYLLNTKFEEDCSLLDIDLETGRTHQIRVHLASIGYPVLGDTTYGFKSANELFSKSYDLHRQFLHAKTLSFIHPKTKKEFRFEAPLLSDLQSVLDQLTPLS